MVSALWEHSIPVEITGTKETWMADDVLVDDREGPKRISLNSLTDEEFIKELQSGRIEVMKRKLTEILGV